MTDNEIRKQMISAREEYIDLIKAELLGPGSEFSLPDAEHELISTTPTSRYSVGILFPQGNVTYQDNDETVPLPESETNENAEDNVAIPSDDTSEDIVESSMDRTVTLDETADENLDEEIGMSTQYMPSSMGITFLASGNCNVVNIDVEFATYRNALIPDCAVPYHPHDPATYTVPPELAGIISYDQASSTLRLNHAIQAKEIRNIFERDTIPENEFRELRNIMYRFLDYSSKGYVRVPHKIENLQIDFSGKDYVECEQNSNLDGTNAKIVALRTRMSEEIWSITIMLVNGLEENPYHANHCIFQSHIEVSTKKNSFIFVESDPNADAEAMDDEELSLELLYRHKKIYGTGLGTSVDWAIDESGNGRLWNDFFPMIEVPSMSFSLPDNELITDAELSMKYLSDLDMNSKVQKLASMVNLINLYKMWVDDLEKTAMHLDSKFTSAASKNIAECRRAYERMYRGIEILQSNDIAYNSFELANRAMFMQRIHIEKQTEMAKSNADRYPGDEEISDWLNGLDYSTESDANCKWRPFQIAFLLMDINSIVNDYSDERSLVDLIWFPTGGGKTEAYLGLAAFTIFTGDFHTLIHRLAQLLLCDTRLGF